MKKTLGIILAVILGLGTIALLWVSMGLLKMVVYIVFMSVVCFLIYLCFWLLFDDSNDEKENI